jgi:uncharacterized protein YbaP (TraB family)
MMRSLTPKLALGAAWALFTLAPCASAQEPAPDASPSTLVEEVEVIAKLPGPALWRVSTPTSQIWLLALPGGMPQGFKWNTVRVTKALAGARELVLPPVATLGIGDLVTVLLDSGHIVHLPPGQTVRSGMPADLRARWEQAARSVGQKPEHYDHFRPVVAAVALGQDAGRSAKLDPSGGRFQIAVIAKLQKAKIRNLASYRVMDLVKGLSETPDDVSSACLSLAADAALTMKDDVLKGAEAWARGDLDALRAHNDVVAQCNSAVPLVRLRNRVATDWAKDLKVELGKPGKVMVAADLDTLTRKGGLLDQLKAEGLEVIGPAY